MTDEVLVVVDIAPTLVNAQFHNWNNTLEQSATEKKKSRQRRKANECEEEILWCFNAKVP